MGIIEDEVVSTGDAFSTGGNLAHGDLAGTGAGVEFEDMEGNLSGPFGDCVVLCASSRCA